MQAYIGDPVEPKERAKALGWLSAATNTGVMIGPVVGSAVWLLGPQTPGLLAAGLCFVNLVSAWRLLPESKAPAAKSETPGERRSISTMVWETLRHPGREASELIWIYAVAMTAFSSMTAVLALSLKGRFGLDEAHIGYIYSILGGVSVIMRAGILGRW
jgi:predicted MFS family arabinose efflux permease